uniref:Bm11785 n=1 Tax=Brugia malayi TaxID=6279 RepID=A0A1I9GA46_BRUMA|nr:Bm11785 [Brugia malayi]
MGKALVSQSQGLRARELSQHLTGCSIWESGPSASAGQHSGAGFGVMGVHWESYKEKCWRAHPGGGDKGESMGQPALLSPRLSSRFQSWPIPTSVSSVKDWDI